jgi:hypothetical protein
MLDSGNIPTSNVIANGPNEASKVSKAFDNLSNPHAEAVDSVTNITIHSSLDNPFQSVNSFSPQVLPGNFTGASGLGIPRAFNFSAREPLGDHDHHDHDGKRPKNATI